MPLRPYIRHYGFFTLLVAALTLLFYLLWAPSERLPVAASNDKLYHGAYFLGLTLLFKLSLTFKDWILIGMLTLLAGGSELSQDWLPYRDASWADFHADMAGVAVGYVIIGCVIVVRRRLICDS